ncbi:MAG: polymer-forming cytoskeletal protein [Bacillota bacterium]|nr:polymer-forming cytoskeletal protein [Bacillota bacterium]
MAAAMLLANFLNYNNPDEEKGKVVIKGAFQGDINMARDVLIAKSGSLSGRVEADKVEIAGVVRGAIKAEKLVIYPSGRLYYNELTCQNLQAYDGCTMIYDLGQEKNAPAPEDEGMEEKGALTITANGTETISEDKALNCEDDIAPGGEKEAGYNPLAAAITEGSDNRLPGEGLKGTRGPKEKYSIRKQPLFYSSY